MIIEISKNLDQVNEAWGLVYQNYVNSGFIDSNSQEIFTFPHYVGPQSIVILGKNTGTDDRITLSVMLDIGQGLPLDGQFPLEIDRLRKRCSRLIEIGLFASSSFQPKQVLHRLQSIPISYGIYHDCMDLVIGVNPKFVPYYNRFFGGELVSGAKQYENLHDAPVALIYLNLRKKEVRDMPLVKKAIADVDSYKFNERYRFPEEDLRGSRIEGYVRKDRMAIPA